jgi:hypothetical protein
MSSSCSVSATGEEEEDVGETRLSAWYDISCGSACGGLGLWGARHASQPTRALRGRGMWRLIAQLMNDKVVAPKG